MNFKYLDSKDALLDSRDETGKIHISWLLADGKIIAVEHIPENYPDFYILTFSSIREYINAVKNTAWITENALEKIVELEEIAE